MFQFLGMLAPLIIPRSGTSFRIRNKQQFHIPVTVYGSVTCLLETLIKSLRVYAASVMLCALFSN